MSRFTIPSKSTRRGDRAVCGKSSKQFSAGLSEFHVGLAFVHPQEAAGDLGVSPGLKLVALLIVSAKVFQGVLQIPMMHQVICVALVDH
jgi:hypothetical protein